ncbi:hypothetical protein [Amycolatopsis sp. NPDC049868]|uniref:hypothetical protein n=1 Tax=Amycolatopsis sp. NPDC049868 TaxID=3363934 RepID=UPI00379313E3
MTIALAIATAGLLSNISTGIASATTASAVARADLNDNGSYALRMISTEGLTAHFQITFEKPYRLTATTDGHLRVIDQAGKTVEDVPPTLTTKSGGKITGKFAVEGPDEFSFTTKDGLVPYFSWGSFLCGTAATISGAVGGGILGGPVGAGFGIGTGIAAAATC